VPGTDGDPGTGEVGRKEILMKNFRILFTDRPSVDVKGKTPFTVARRFFGKRNMEIRGYVDHGNLRMPEGPGRRPYRDNPFIVPSVSDYEKI